MSIEAEAKGNGFISAIRALERMLGPRLSEVVAALPSETAALISRPPLSVAWIPMRHVRSVMRAAHEVGFAGDLAKMKELGRQSVAHDLSGVYAVFIRIASPKFVTERAAKLFANYSRNAGRLSVKEAGSNYVLLEYQDVFEGAPFYWAYQQGGVIAALDATGVKGAATEIVSGGGNTNNAIVRASWD